MRLTREEACELLAVEEGASHRDLKMAFYAKSKEWHPDKVPDERKQEATVMFQRINAAYQKLLAPESEDEGEGMWEDGGFDDMDILYEFFRYMEEKMHAEQSRGGRRRGGGGGGPSMGGMFGAGGQSGARVVFMGPFGPMGLSFGANSGSCVGPGAYGPPPGAYGPPPSHRRDYGRRRASRRVQKSESESESEWEDEDDEDDLEWYEAQQERLFMRMKAEERAEEQNRVRQQYDDANRLQAQHEARLARWLAQLARPARVACSDTSITVDADRGAKKRLADFLSGKTPAGFFWEVEFRPLIPSQPASDWQRLRLAGGDSLVAEVTGLEPGTKYAFRARTGVVEDAAEAQEEGSEEEAVTCGPWSTEATHSTSGVAPVRAAAPAAAPATSGAAAAKRNQRKAKQAQRQEAQRKAEGNEAAAERQRAAAQEQRQAEAEREQARQAAIARAQEEYDREAAAVRKQAEAAAKEKEAARKPAAGKKAGGAAAAKPAPSQASGSGTAAATPAAQPKHGGSAASRAARPAPAYTGLPEFQLPPGPPAAQPAMSGVLASAPAMRAPTRRDQIRSGPSTIAAAAASGAAGAGAAMAREAAAHGMSVAEYRDWQDALALEEAIQMSLALEESKKMADGMGAAMEESRRMAEQAQQAQQAQPARRQQQVAPPLGPRPGSRTAASPQPDGFAMPAPAPLGPLAGGGPSGRSSRRRGNGGAASGAGEHEWQEPAAAQPTASPLMSGFAPASGRSSASEGRRSGSSQSSQQPPALRIQPSPAPEPAGDSYADYGWGYLDAAPAAPAPPPRKPSGGRGQRSNGRSAKPSAAQQALAPAAEAPQANQASPALAPAQAPVSVTFNEQPAAQAAPQQAYSPYSSHPAQAQAQAYPAQAYPAQAYEPQAYAAQQAQQQAPVYFHNGQYYVAVPAGAAAPVQQPQAAMTAHKLSPEHAAYGAMPGGVGAAPYAVPTAASTASAASAGYAAPYPAYAAYPAASRSADVQPATPAALAPPPHAPRSTGAYRPVGMYRPPMQAATAGGAAGASGSSGPAAGGAPRQFGALSPGQ